MTDSYRVRNSPRHTAMPAPTRNHASPVMPKVPPVIPELSPVIPEVPPVIPEPPPVIPEPPPVIPELPSGIPKTPLWHTQNSPLAYPKVFIGYPEKTVDSQE